jgi:hypothetical protein
MPKVTHSLRYGTHSSLVVTRALLREFCDVASESGWIFNGCKLTARGDREIDLKCLEDLSEISPHVLESLVKAFLTFKTDLRDERAYAFLTIENSGLFPLGKPLRLSVSSPEEGPLLGLRSGVAGLVQVRRQWYSPLSRALGYWIGYMVLLNLSLAVRGIATLFHQSWHLPRSIDIGAAVSGLVLIVLQFARVWIYPSNEFNLTDPPYEKTPSAVLRKRLWIALAAIGTPLLGIAIKNLFG